MSYEEFQMELLTRLRSLHPELSISLDKQIKNNNTIMTGITLSDRKNKINPNPIIYLESYYQNYQQGKSLENIINDIFALYNQTSLVHFNNFNINDFDSVKDHIMMKVINTEMNSLYLEGVPHLRLDDLSIIYSYVLSEIYTIPIDNVMMESWHITVETLHQCAVANIRKPPYELMTMDIVLQKLASEAGEELILETAPDNPTLYVLSNTTHQWGDSVITYPMIMDRVAYILGDDYYILPSSIHEVILIKKKEMSPEMKLNSMIQSINKEQVEHDEWLSDHAYLYSEFRKKYPPVLKNTSLNCNINDLFKCYITCC